MIAAKSPCRNLTLLYLLPLIILKSRNNIPPYDNQISVTCANIPLHIPAPSIVDIEPVIGARTCKAFTVTSDCCLLVQIHLLHRAKREDCDLVHLASITFDHPLGQEHQQ